MGVQWDLTIIRQIVQAASVFYLLGLAVGLILRLLTPPVNSRE
jgi:phage shock protein PspC (stress-responsive transcriptional regulator)